MKIAHVVPYMHPAAGGPPVVVDRLSCELAARGHDVSVLTTDLFADHDRDWNAGGRPYSLKVFPAARGNGYVYSGPLREALRDIVPKCDVVHVHTLWTYASLAAARHCLRSGVPYLVMPHGMLDPHSVQRGWLKKQLYGRVLEWPLLRRAQRMCYTHPEEQRLAEKTCRGLPPGCIIELGAGSPPERSRAELRESFLNQHPQLRGRTVVLFLGRIHPKKGFDILIPAFEKVRRQRPGTRLLIVGSGEPSYVKSIRFDVERRGLLPYATFTGPLYGDEKWEAMAASDLFVLPSYQENFALTVVDAIQSGLPVVVSRRVNLWEDIVQAGAGRDCETNIASIENALLNALTDQAWRDAVPSAGQLMLATRFNWSVTADRLESVYAQIAGKPAPLAAGCGVVA